MYKIIIMDENTVKVVAVIDPWKEEANKDPFINKSYSEHIRRALDYISEHATEELSLQEVADHVFLSSFYLSKRIHQETNMSFSDLVRRKRIDRSKEFLLNGQMKIADIAAEVGYLSSTNFTRAFRRETGMSAMEWRKRNSSTVQTM